MAVQIAKHLFTVDEYYRIAEIGLLGPEPRVELIEGEIIDMSPMGLPHASCVARLNRMFWRGLGDRVVLWPQLPLRLNLRSEPEPDLAILAPRQDAYKSGHPVALDVFLVTEVSDSTLDYDRYVKGPLYAGANIPDYWIANLADGQVEVHRDPTPDGYQTIQVMRPGDVIRPLAFPDLEVAVADILG